MSIDPNLPVPLAPETPPAATEPEWRPGRENPPWSGWDVLRIALVGLFAIFVFSSIAFVIAMRSPAIRGLSPAEIARDPEIVLPAQFLAYVVVVVFMYFLVRTRALGFLRGVRWNWPARTALGLLAGGVALALLVQITSSFLPIPKSLPIERYFRNPTGAWLMAVFGVSVAPFVEELFFRGFLYPVLARRLGLTLGVVFTALGFALLHSGQLANAWAPLLMLFIVGVALTGVRARTGSVAASFLIHVGYNATLFVVLYVASDHFRHFERVT